MAEKHSCGAGVMKAKYKYDNMYTHGRKCIGAERTYFLEVHNIIYITHLARQLLQVIFRFFSVAGAPPPTWRMCASEPQHAWRAPGMSRCIAIATDLRDAPICVELMLGY